MLVTASLAGLAWDGPPDPGDRLVLGLIGPERAVTVDMASGRTATRRLPGGTLCHGSLDLVGDRVVFMGSRGGRATVLSLELDLRGQPRAIARAEMFASQPRGAFFLGRMRDGEHRSFLGVRRASSRLHPPPAALRRSAAKVALQMHPAFDRGLVFDGDGRITVWDPEERTVTRHGRRAIFLGARGPGLAWCEGRCRRVETLRGSIRPPRGVRLVGAPGRMSPDGTKLVLQAARGEGAQLLVADLTRRTIRRVPGGATGPYGAAAWALSGERFYFAAPSGRLMSYGPGDRRAIRLPHRVRGPVMSISAG